MQAITANFQTYLETGKVGESRIAGWLKGRGYFILPVYEIEISCGKGPRLFSPSRDIIAPDILAFKGHNKETTIWIEAKHKTAFTWHRITGQWTTGIDLRHYTDYCEIQKSTPFPVWIMFLHEGGKAKDSPNESPAGLYGNNITILQSTEHHRSDKWANGMVYWDIDHLKKLAEISEL